MVTRGEIVPLREWKLLELKPLPIFIEFLPLILLLLEMANSKREILPSSNSLFIVFFSFRVKQKFVNRNH